MTVRGDQGDSDQQAACLQYPLGHPPSTPDLLDLGILPATGMRPDLPSILSLYIKDDLPFYCYCTEEDFETDEPEPAPVVEPVPVKSEGAKSKGKGK